MPGCMPAHLLLSCLLLPLAHVWALLQAMVAASEQHWDTVSPQNGAL